MRIAVIVNPSAGRHGREPPAGAIRGDVARAWLKVRGIDGEVTLTSSRGHAHALARDFVARGFDRIVAWGGDGTVNEVAGPIVGSHSTLAVVRAGSGDGLARGLGLPAEPDRALDVAVAASRLRLDVGWLGCRHFLNVAGFGFDAAVARAFNERSRRGFLGYLLAGASSIWSYRSPSYDLRLDGADFRGAQFIVAFANSREYGNGFVIAPDANPADGLLDAVVVADGSIVQQIWRGRRLCLASDAPASGILRRRIRTATVAGAALLAHVDGEVFEAESPVSVRVQPAALWVAVPRSGPGGAADGG